MEQEHNLENYGLKDANMKILKKNGEKSNNQCDYAPVRAEDLKRHLTTHRGEKSKRCNQCDFASSYASVLKTHLKAQSGENSNKPKDKVKKNKKTKTK